MDLSELSGLTAILFVALIVAHFTHHNVAARARRCIGKTFRASKTVTKGAPLHFDAVGTILFITNVAFAKHTAGKAVDLQALIARVFECIEPWESKPGIGWVTPLRHEHIAANSKRLDKDTLIPLKKTIDWIFP